jgi:hypothetical protein
LTHRPIVQIAHIVGATTTTAAAETALVLAVTTLPLSIAAIALAAHVGALRPSISARAAITHLAATLHARHALERVLKLVVRDLLTLAPKVLLAIALLLLLLLRTSRQIHGLPLAYLFGCCLYACVAFLRF